MPDVVWQGLPQCGSSVRERSIYPYVLILHLGTIIYYNFFFLEDLKVLLGIVLTVHLVTEDPDH